ncbi:MAG: threonylcarbamoyl-AMP synthase [Chloroflexi bacterium]|nr:threonylcarbamoyl-AMP synthase [Chloroflexota bacterium]
MISDEVSVAIDNAVGVLRDGGVAIFPTDTVMGLGVDAMNQAAIARLFGIKQRDANNPLPVLIPDESSWDAYATEISDVARNLARSFWPGGLTIIVEADPQLADSIRSANGAVGFRVPDHPVTLEFLRRFGGPITGTSANLSGVQAPSDSSGIDPNLRDLVDIVIPGSGLQEGLSSSVVDCSGPIPRILRVGATPVFEILSVIQNR